MKLNWQGRGKVQQVVAGHWKREASDWHDDMIFFHHDAQLLLVCGCTEETI